MTDKKWKKRYKQAERESVVAEARIVELKERVMDLMEELAAERARSSLLLSMIERPSDTIEAMAKVLNPQPDITRMIDEIVTAKPTDGFEDFGVKPGENFPDVEFDDWIDPTMKDKVQGEWTATETMGPPNRMNGTTPLPDPDVNPNDGTPRFRAGSTAPPPVGGTE